MNLPLGQGDKEEISDAYKKAASEIKASAASLKALVGMLEQKMACLDPVSRKALDDPFIVVGASLFKLGVLRFRVEQANFKGREFSALPDANSPGS